MPPAPRRNESRCRGCAAAWRPRWPGPPFGVVARCRGITTPNPGPAGLATVTQFSDAGPDASSRAGPTVRPAASRRRDWPRPGHGPGGPGDRDSASEPLPRSGLPAGRPGAAAAASHGHGGRADPGPAPAVGHCQESAVALRPPGRGNSGLSRSGPRLSHRQAATD